MGGTTLLYIECNEPDTERQDPYVALICGSLKSVNVNTG
jgi:hypothetical protein